MGNRASRKDLEDRLKALEEENAALREAAEQLRESEEKFKTIFENANDHIAYVSLDGTVIDVNHKFEDVFGHTREEVIGKKYYEFTVLTKEDWRKTIDHAWRLLAGQTAPNEVLEFEARARDGRKLYIEVNPVAVTKDGETKGILAITRDVTARKREEELLRRNRDELERLVQERTSNLEEANAALRLMLQKAEEVKTELEDTIRSNVRQFVFPYLERLKKTELDEIQNTYLSSLEQSLNDITSPLLPGASTQYLKLTPTEIQVANLVKQGRTTKDIAEILNMSLRTIDTHRYNIRTKLGLRNKKANLRTFLLSMQ